MESQDKCESKRRFGACTAGLWLLAIAICSGLAYQSVQRRRATQIDMAKSVLNRILENEARNTDECSRGQPPQAYGGVEVGGLVDTLARNGVGKNFHKAFVEFATWDKSRTRSCDNPGLVALVDWREKLGEAFRADYEAWF